MKHWYFIAVLALIQSNFTWAHQGHKALGHEEVEYQEHEEEGIPLCDSPPCVDSPFIDLNGNGVIELNEAVVENLAYCDSNFNGLIDEDEKRADNLDCSPLLGDGNQIFANRPIARLGLQKGELILTIDDGPNANITGKILDLLAFYNIKAAFFLTGNRIATNAQLVRRMYNEGHTVGNHTYSHAVKVSPGNLHNEIIRAHQEIAGVLGGEPQGRLLFRAPGLAWSQPKAETLNEGRFTRNYIGPIHANLGTDAPRADWSCWSKGVSAEKCAAWYYQDIANAGRGIVLTHDVFYRSGSTRNTYEMLKILLAKLDANGGIKNKNRNGFWSFVDIQNVAALDQFEVDNNGNAPRMLFSNSNFNVRSEELLRRGAVDDASKIVIGNGSTLKTGDITEIQDTNESFPVGNHVFKRVKVTGVRSGDLQHLIGTFVLIATSAF